MRRWLLRAALVALCLPAATAAWAERRLAFVAGINDYANLRPEMQLRRAVQDATTVADALDAIGFKVTRLTSGASLGGFMAAFGAFTRAIEPGDTVLLYFAGHGIAIENTNYLIPSDIPALTAGGESVVRKLAVAEPDLISDLQRQGARITVLVIDACRDNPFPKSTGTRSLGQSRGLSGREPPQGVFSLYSAGAGQQALDRLPGTDPDPNSVFTRIFVRELRKPGVNLLDLGETVREEVSVLARGADHDQIPAVYNQVLGARRILLAGALPAGSPAPAAPAPPILPPDMLRPDQAAWSLLRTSADVALLRRFLAQYPDTALRTEAEGRIATLVAEQDKARLASVADPERECDRLAANSYDSQRPAGMPGVNVTAANAPAAIEACRRAVAANPAGARVAYQLGRGLTVSGQDKEAAVWFERASRLGSAAGMCSLGYLTEMGRGGLARSEAEAARLYRQAAELGDFVGMFNLANMIEQGRGGLAKDEREVLRLRRAAADRDFAPALAALAAMYETGRGELPKNEVEAARLYGRAAAQGNAGAMTSLGLMRMSGRGGLPADDVEAVRLFRGASDGNWAPAIAYLAFMYESGRGGLVLDGPEAARLYRKSADLGFAFAMANLAQMMAGGRGGLAFDAAEAVRLFRRAGELGDNRAAYMMAMLNRDGQLGLTRDRAAARAWFERAGQLGHAEARTRLSEMDTEDRLLAQQQARPAAPATPPR